MPELQWDPFDFFYCLEVEPEIDKYGFGYLYKVAKDDLELLVDVQPLESYVRIEIRHQRNNTSIVEVRLFVLGEVRHINDKRGEYLEFARCLMVPQVHSGRKVIDDIPSDWTVELRIKPSIQIRYRD